MEALVSGPLIELEEQILSPLRSELLKFIRYVESREHKSSCGRQCKGTRLRLENARSEPKVALAQSHMRL